MLSVAKKLAANMIVGKSDDPYDFPKLDSLHNHCELNFKVPMECSEIYYHVEDIVQHNLDTTDPKGTYKPYKKEYEKMVWAVREAPKGIFEKKKDDVIFELKDGEDGTCHVKTKSRSKDLGIVLGNHSRNFCNMYNVMKQIWPAILDG